MPRPLPASRCPVCAVPFAGLRWRNCHRRIHAMPPEPSAIATLGWIARAKALASKTNHGTAVEWLAANRAPDQVQRVFKAAIGAGSTTDSDLAFGINIGAWSDSLRTRSAFYRILADAAFTRVPAHQRVGVITSTPL